MKAIELNESNTMLRLEGSEATRSMDIKNLEVKKWPAADGKLTLTVLDEKDIPIYNHVVDPAEAKEDGSIVVDKRFVFYEHLTVQLKAQPAGNPFSVTVHFE